MTRCLPFSLFLLKLDTCALIVVLNAAVNYPSIISVLPDYVFRHYRYLRTKEPNLTPDLQRVTTRGVYWMLIRPSRIFRFLPKCIRRTHLMWKHLCQQHFARLTTFSNGFSNVRNKAKICRCGIDKFSIEISPSASASISQSSK